MQNEHLSESKDITDQNNPSQSLVNSEKKFKLVKWQRVFSDELCSSWGTLLGRYSLYAFGYGALTVGIGAGKIFSPMITSNIAESDIRVNILLIGMGSLTCGTSITFWHSTKFQEFIENHLRTSYNLPFHSERKLPELNQLLNSLGLEPIETKYNYTINEITLIKEKINTAIEETNTLKQKEMGKEVIKSALGSMGFFPNPGKIVLDYLLPNKEVVNELIPRPVRASMRKMA